MKVIKAVSILDMFCRQSQQDFFPDRVYVGCERKKGIKDDSSQKQSNSFSLKFTWLACHLFTSNECYKPWKSPTQCRVHVQTSHLYKNIEGFIFSINHPTRLKIYIFWLPCKK